MINWIYFWSESVKKIQEESGFKIQSDEIDLFSEAILDGCWDRALDISKNIEFIDNSQEKIKLMLKEHIFVELIYDGNTTDAIIFLQTELNNNIKNINRLNNLI